MRLEIDALSHRYGEELAVDDVSFGIEAGELVALVGPSGCGKTTVVQSVAGHVRPTAGRIALRGEDVTDVPPEARGVSVVFQRSTLYPHMTVGENVAYGLGAQDIAPARREELVADHLELVSLADQRAARPAELSGGQRRRAELARALAPSPDVLLLDEPLSALDRTLRIQLRDEIARIQRETGVTTLFVTHDQEDAMALADRLVVMNGGRIVASGRPRDLYESPPTPFVASFLGRANAFDATVLDADPLTLRRGDGTVEVSGFKADAPGVSEGSTVTCHVHPGDLSVRPIGTETTDPSIRGTVTRVADVGRRYDVTVGIGAGEDLVAEQVSSPPAVDDDVAVAFPADRLHLFDREAGRRVSLSAV
ncbi:ABC transporter ATP-binding protein [Halobellus limi]|uniref:Molybdate/tungstate import ATP-binding protein WtpC n=1 Tax=Halobellus limi TaxID=699433 RepID=A0A1H5UWN1_9EURY|nr:ABC transporter ATP-binding protein [Halobellus limi]QCC46892.1 ABC transporter ATP-binding protein [Halobellus limi]SEF79572.1 molybdate/tungstate transport system ATP-binding protein [Halobellus limi]